LTSLIQEVQNVFLILNQHQVLAQEGINKNNKMIKIWNKFFKRTKAHS